MAGPAPVHIVASRNADRRAITAYFMAQHAIMPGDAIPYTPANPEQRAQFELMLSRGVIKPMTKGYYWLDTAAYTEDSRSRQGRVGMIAALIAVALAGLLVLLY